MYLENEFIKIEIEIIAFGQILAGLKDGRTTKIVSVEQMNDQICKCPRYKVCAKSILIIDGKNSLPGGVVHLKILPLWWEHTTRYIRQFFTDWPVSAECCLTRLIPICVDYHS